jgi:putative toxin-antitoxin system antitoxin component (TIGR02293 family)
MAFKIARAASPPHVGPELGALSFVAETFRAAEATRAILKQSAAANEASAILERSSRLVQELTGVITTSHPHPDHYAGLRDLILQGLPSAALNVLESQYQVPIKTLADWLDTSTKTLWRRRAGLLSRTETDLAVRYGRVFEQAKSAFGTEDAAREWLTSAQASLNGAVPVELLRTELGAREVERIIELIDYGEYL